MLARRFDVIRAARLGARGKASEALDKVQRACVLLLKGDSLEAAALAAGFRGSGQGRHAVRAGDRLTRAVRRLGCEVQFSQRDIDSDCTSEGGLIFPAARWQRGYGPAEYDEFNALQARLRRESAACYGPASPSDYLAPVQPMASYSKASREPNREQVRRRLSPANRPLQGDRPRRHDRPAHDRSDKRDRWHDRRESWPAHDKRQCRRSALRAFKGKRPLSGGALVARLGEHARAIARCVHPSGSGSGPAFPRVDTWGKLATLKAPAGSARQASKASARQASARQASKASAQGETGQRATLWALAVGLTPRATRLTRGQRTLHKQGRLSRHTSPLACQGLGVFCRPGALVRSVALVPLLGRRALTSGKGVAPWCVRSGACALVRVLWCVCSGACALVRVLWCVCSGACALVRVLWCVCSGACALVRVLWCVRPGACALVRAPWCVRPGACALAPRSPRFSTGGLGSGRIVQASVKLKRAYCFWEGHALELLGRRRLLGGKCAFHSGK